MVHAKYVIYRRWIGYTFEAWFSEGDSLIGWRPTEAWAKRAAEKAMVGSDEQSADGP